MQLEALQEFTHHGGHSTVGDQIGAFHGPAVATQGQSWCDAAIVGRQAFQHRRPDRAVRIDAVQKYQHRSISTGVLVLDESGSHSHSFHDVPRTMFRLVHKGTPPFPAQYYPVLPEPALTFGAPLGPFRRRPWAVTTPGVLSRAGSRPPVRSDVSRSRGHQAV